MTLIAEHIEGDTRDRILESRRAASGAKRTFAEALMSA